MYKKNQIFLKSRNNSDFSAVFWVYEQTLQDLESGVCFEWVDHDPVGVKGQFHGVHEHQSGVLSHFVHHQVPRGCNDSDTGPDKQVFKHPQTVVRAEILFVD